MSKPTHPRISRRYAARATPPARRLNPTAQALLAAVSEPLVEDTSPPAALERVVAAAAALRQEDERLERMNSDVTRLDDPVGHVDRASLIADFARSRNESMVRFVSLMMQETADLSSLQDVNTVLRSIIGDSAAMNTASVERLVENLHELRLVQEVSKHLGLEDKVRDQLLRAFVAREWGPRHQPPQVVVKNPPANSGGRPAPEAPNKGLRTAPRPEAEAKPVVQRSRGGGANPFGNIR